MKRSSTRCDRAFKSPCAVRRYRATVSGSSTTPSDSASTMTRTDASGVRRSWPTAVNRWLRAASTSSRARSASRSRLVISLKLTARSATSSDPSTGTTTSRSPPATFVGGATQPRDRGGDAAGQQVAERRGDDGGEHEQDGRELEVVTTQEHESRRHEHVQEGEDHGEQIARHERPGELRRAAHPAEPVGDGADGDGDERGDPEELRHGHEVVLRRPHEQREHQQPDDHRGERAPPRRPRAGADPDARKVRRGTRSRFEPVAHAPRRGDVARLRGVVLDLRAHSPHVHGDGARVDVVGRSPDQLEQLVAVEDGVRASRKREEKVELLGRQRALRAADGDRCVPPGR